MTPQERASAMNVAVAGYRPLIFTRDDVTIRAEQIDAPADTVGWAVTAWTGQGASATYLPLDGANPFYFVNPPLMVPDGGVDAEGHATFVLDALAAAKEILFLAVANAARARGWGG